MGGEARTNAARKRGVAIGAALVVLLAAWWWWSYVAGTPEPTPVTWLVYGDSLSESTEPYLSKYGSIGKKFYGGTAPCNWVVNGLGDEAARYAPRKVLLQFIGNLPTCMRGRDPQTGYEHDLTTIARFWLNRHVPVVVVLSPATPDDSMAWARRAEHRVAARLGLAVNDAGQAVLSNGRFTYLLPCLPAEGAAQGCGAEAAGQIRVRDTDGIHFGSSAPGYSSGAFRFAAAEARS